MDFRLPLIGGALNVATHFDRGHAIRFGAGARPATKLIASVVRCPHDGAHSQNLAKCDDLQIVRRYDLGSGVITDAGVAALAAHTKTPADFSYIDAGTGTTAESAAQTALVTPWGGARVAVTFTNPSAPVQRATATISFTGGFAVTEWGIFSAASVGTMLDRRKFSAINVVSGDGIQFQHDLTFPSGG